jgi:predicted PurR-regulated permease PerM
MFVVRHGRCPHKQQMLSDESPPSFPSITPSRSMGPGFVGRVLIVAGIALLALLIVHLRQVVVLAFGCVLVGVALRSGVSWLRRHSGLSDRVALAAVLIGLALLAALGIWSLGEPISEEFGALRVALPKGLEAITRWLDSNAFGRWLLQWWREADAPLEWTRVAGLFGSAVGAIGAAVLMAVVGIYLAADPGLYRRGVLHLMPYRQRARVERALGDVGTGLSRWLLGQGVAMLAVGVLTAAGLALIGMPLALPLGIIAGLLEFIPFVGTFGAGALIVLLAFTQGEAQAIYAALVCLAVQQFENYVIQPFVQRWAIALPPALGLIAVIVFGATFGPLGVVFAVPLMVVMMLLVQRLYVAGALGDGAGAPERMGGDSAAARESELPHRAAPPRRDDERAVVR